jgi:hypothetical protein
MIGRVSSHLENEESYERQDSERRRNVALSSSSLV